MRGNLLTAVLGMAGLVFGPGGQQPKPAEGPGRAQPAGERYKLHASDVLGLTFRFTPDFNQDTTVQADGFVQLKGLTDSVHLQGLTVSEAQREIVKAYAKILNEPEVSVTLKDFERPYFVVSGSVNNPGKFDYRDHTT